MNRRTLLIGTSALGLAAFAGGAYVLNQRRAAETEAAADAIVGAVEVANVAAVVLPNDMPMILLGNSFLNRFTMRRDADVMRLEKKP